MKSRLFLLLVCTLATVAHADDVNRLGPYEVRGEVIAPIELRPVVATGAVGFSVTRENLGIRGLESLGIGGTLTFTAEPVRPELVAETELWRGEGRFQNPRLEQIGRESLQRVVPASGDGDFWSVVTGPPGGTDDPPTNYVVATCTFADPERSRSICRSSKLIAPGLLLEYAYDERDLARRAEIEGFLEARLTAALRTAN